MREVCSGLRQIDAHAEAPHAPNEAARKADAQREQINTNFARDNRKRRTNSEEAVSSGAPSISCCSSGRKRLDGTPYAGEKDKMNEADDR